MHRLLFLLSSSLALVVALVSSAAANAQSSSVFVSASADLSKSRLDIEPGGSGLFVILGYVGGPGTVRAAGRFGGAPDPFAEYTFEPLVPSVCLPPRIAPARFGGGEVLAFPFTVP